MSNIYSVIYSSEAKDDLKSIYSYIAFDLKVPDIAQNQVNRIRKEIRSLAFMPARYQIIDWEPLQSMKIHKLPIDNFIAYYTINSETLTVTIIRIVYGGRNTQNIIKTQ